MRKFIDDEREKIITLDELRVIWEESEKENMTFEQFVYNCVIDKNGMLYEIQTDETPKGWERYAVSYYRVCLSDNPEDFLLSWLTPQEKEQAEREWGYVIVSEQY